MSQTSPPESVVDAVDVEADADAAQQPDTAAATEAAVQEEVDGPDQAPEDGEESSGEGVRRRGARKPSKARLAELEQEGEIAADYLEGLLDIADLDGDIDMDVEGDRASVSIVGAELRHLVGPRGRVLEAVQELTRLAVLRATGERSRLMLDIGGYRAGRREELTELGRKSAERARSEGKEVRLDPMTPFERKIVHDAVAEAGLSSESEGEEPNRRVVVLPG